MSAGVKAFLFAAMVIGVYGGYQGQVLTVFASVLIAVALGLAFVWNKYAFYRLQVQRRISRRKAEFGQSVHYELEVVNDKFLPLLWLRVTDQVPAGLDFVRQGVVRRVLGAEYFSFRDVFSLGWYQRATRRYAVTPTQRGYYQFGPGRVYHAGSFGLFENTLEEALGHADLIVFPKILSLAQLGLDYHQLFGRRPREGWIHTDPLNIMGVRPYQSTDSMRAINWKASARHQQLETNVEKPSMDDEVHIFLESATPGAWWEWSERNAVEVSIMAAASLVESACQAKRRVGIYSNLAQKRSGPRGGTIVRPGQHQDQRDRVLTALAMMQSYSIGKLTSILEREKRRIPPGSRVIVIAGEPGEQLRRCLTDYQRRYNLTLVQLGPKEQELPGIHRLFLDREVPWDERTQLEIA